VAVVLPATVKYFYSSEDGKKKWELTEENAPKEQQPQLGKHNSAVKKEKGCWLWGPSEQGYRCTISTSSCPSKQETNSSAFPVWVNRRWNWVIEC